MKNQNTEKDYAPIQLKMPVDLEKIIKTSDPVYSFNNVMAHIDEQKNTISVKIAKDVLIGRSVTKAKKTELYG